MNTLGGLIQSKQYLNTPNVISQNETLALFDALTLKEKCLYLVKISKRNTGYQTILLTVLTLVFMGVEYLFSILI